MIAFTPPPLPPSRAVTIEADLGWCGARVFTREHERQIAILTDKHLTADEQALIVGELPLGVRPVFCSRSPRHELPLFIWCGLLGFAFLAGWFACFWGWR